jgi:hypothetical protein
MHRRWIVAAPVGLLVVGWLHYASHGEAATAIHSELEDSAAFRTVSSPPLADDPPVEAAPTPPPVVARPPASAAPVALGGAPVDSGAPPAPAPPTESVGDDVQEGINAVANVDYDEAAAKFEHACSRGSAFACGALGELLATGTGLPRNVPRGRAFLTRGCNTTETWACNHLSAIDREEKSPR